ncbi:sigma-70 family RNA polymerase sigma factor [Aeoliella sp. ICT_H6.2]|uniref:Sigma-70 family RNA polymerase sigma factor n=1 Tax=Aeoliella straminimaris TaxID=2954799 RepID=A0A9X2JF47_9BACT|nr:sigma-70 family RNA polymerase sigma factor [Aeoliella straminimaris]
MFSFIYSMLHNQADAEDVYQQTTIVMWEKFGEYQPGTSFVNWALAIAHNKIKQFRRQTGRDRLHFDDRVMQLMAETYSELEVRKSSSERFEGLLHCLSKLTDKQRRVLRLRYSDSFSIQDLAQRERKSEAAMVMVLARLRKSLQACITAAISRGLVDG